MRTSIILMLLTISFLLKGNDSLLIKRTRTDFKIKTDTKCLFSKTYYYHNNFKKTEYWFCSDTIELYSLYDSNNNQLEYYQDMGAIRYLKSNSFDSGNNLISYSIYKNNKHESTVKFETIYNKNGNLIFLTKDKFKIYFDYNDKEELKIKTTINFDGSKEVEEFNKGLIITKKKLDSLGKVVYECKFTYDSFGLRSLTKRDSNNEIFEEEIYEEGKLIDKKWLYGTHFCKYHYDQSKNLIKMEVYGGVDNIFLLEYRIYDYNQYNEIVRERQYSADGELTLEFISEYK